jgi:hypothetical protein
MFNDPLAVELLLPQRLDQRFKGDQMGKMKPGEPINKIGRLDDQKQHD